MAWHPGAMVKAADYYNQSVVSGYVTTSGGAGGTQLGVESSICGDTSQVTITNLGETPYWSPQVPDTAGHYYYPHPTSAWETTWPSGPYGSNSDDFQASLKEALSRLEALLGNGGEPDAEVAPAGEPLNAPGPRAIRLRSVK